jgi:hypothetical protein
MVMLGQSGGPTAEDLVNQLGSARFSERESAESALATMGRLALPALRNALESKDLEVRSRAGSLVKKIESDLLTTATPTRLDFADTPLTEVVRAIQAETGMRLTLMPENERTWQARRITIHESKELTFWAAIDRLCREARLNYAVVNVFPMNREQSLSLFDSRLLPTAPTYDSGPFRVTLLGLHYDRDLSFTPAPVANPATPPPALGRADEPAKPEAFVRPSPGDASPFSRISEGFYAKLQLSAEPRLSVAQTGPLRIVEAVDDKAQSLAFPVRQGQAGTVQQTSGYVGISNGPQLMLQAALKRPIEPGKTIRKLRGVVPITVTTRKGNPIAVSLDEAPGKLYRDDQTEIRLREVRVKPGERPQSIELEVRSDTADPGMPGMGNSLQFRRADGPRQIEVVDEKGQPVPLFVGFLNPETARMTITITPQNGAVPKELRYYSIARATADVSFEFTEIPIP